MDEVQSDGASEEKQVFFTEDDNKTDEQNWERKKWSKTGPKVDDTVMQIDAISENIVKELKNSLKNYTGPIKSYLKNLKIRFCYN